MGMICSPDSIQKSYQKHFVRDTRHVSGQFLIVLQDEIRSLSCFAVRRCLKIINKGHKKQRVVNGNIHTLYTMNSWDGNNNISKRIAQDLFIIIAIVTHSNPLSLMFVKRIKVELV